MSGLTPERPQSRGVTTSAPASNFSPATLGQAKWMALQAKKALESVLPNVALQIDGDLTGGGSPVLQNGWTVSSNPDEDLAVITIGQLKALAHPFHARLSAAVGNQWMNDHLLSRGLPASAGDPAVLNADFLAADGVYYPWKLVQSPENGAPANLGQLKICFDLPLTEDLESPLDGLPDLWEHAVVHANPPGGYWTHIGLIHAGNAAQAAAETGISPPPDDNETQHDGIFEGAATAPPNYVYISFDEIPSGYKAVDINSSGQVLFKNHDYLSAAPGGPTFEACQETPIAAIWSPAKPPGQRIALVFFKPESFNAHAMHFKVPFPVTQTVVELEKPFTSTQMGDLGDFYSIEVLRVVGMGDDGSVMASCNISFSRKATDSRTDTILQGTFLWSGVTEDYEKCEIVDKDGEHGWIDLPAGGAAPGFSRHIGRGFYTDRPSMGPPLTRALVVKQMGRHDGSAPVPFFVQTYHPASPTSQPDTPVASGQGDPTHNDYYPKLPTYRGRIWIPRSYLPVGIEWIGTPASFVQVDTQGYPRPVELPSDLGEAWGLGDPEGLLRMHTSPDMQARDGTSGIVQLDERGIGIGDTTTMRGVWCNGSWHPLSTLTDSAAPADLIPAQITRNGIIRAQLGTSGLTSDAGILLPVEVRWQAVPGFDNLDTHIDPWEPHEPNGMRIFPGYKNPDESTIRNGVDVIVKTSPALVGKTVKVKAFDIDDSTSEDFDKDVETGDAIIDTDDKGNDNIPDYLNTPKSGRFFESGAWGDDEAEGTVDANGETKFTLNIGMQPGNNYKVVVTEVDGQSFTPAQVTDSSSDTYLGPKPAQTSKAPSTPMLTVWRRLWVENDSMEAIPVDAYGYKRNDLSSDLVPPAPVISNLSYSPTTVRTSFGIDFISDQSSFLTLEHGRIIVQSLEHPVIDTRSYQVTVAGNHGSVPIGSGYRLYDDDDFGLNRAPLPRNDLIDDTFKNVYKPAFIEVVDAADFKGQDYNPSKTVDFYRNHPVMIGPWGFQTPGVWDDAINLTDSIPLWVGNLIAGYQGEVGDDRDPSSEGLMEGITPGSRRYSIVYVENVRDHEDAVIRNPSADNTAMNSEIARNIKLTAAHEIGHMPGGGDETSHHAENMLMDEDGYGSDNGLNFSPKSILRFRKTNQWQQP